MADRIPFLQIGIRTNGIHDDLGILRLFDKISISLTSLNKDIYAQTMGGGKPPDIDRILKTCGKRPIKVNVVLCPETSEDIRHTVRELAEMGVKTINLREPYGQPHIGNPYKYLEEYGTVHGMPKYRILEADVVYWDVHYVEVESVNLYANGHVSVSYPVTEGVDFDKGIVLDQSHFQTSGRQHDQWAKWIN